MLWSCLDLDYSTPLQKGKQQNKLTRVSWCWAEVDYHQGLQNSCEHRYPYNPDFAARSPPREQRGGNWQCRRLCCGTRTSPPHHPCCPGESRCQWSLEKAAGEAPGRRQGWHRQVNKTRLCHFLHGYTEATNWSPWLTIFPMIPVPTDSVMISLILLSWSFLANISNIIPTRRTICTCKNKADPKFPERQWKCSSDLPALSDVLLLWLSLFLIMFCTQSLVATPPKGPPVPKQGSGDNLSSPSSHQLCWAHYIPHSGASLQTGLSCEVTET